MIRIKFIAKQKTMGEFTDECNVSSLETAEEEIKAIVDEYNRVEKSRYPEAETRYFIRMLTDQKGQIQHDYRKGRFGRKDKYGIYDEWKCSQCELEVKVRGLDVPRGGDCFPERTCSICQKVFKTEENYTRHKERIHQDWL